MQEAAETEKTQGKQKAYEAYVKAKDEAIQSVLQRRADIFHDQIAFRRKCDELVILRKKEIFYWPGSGRLFSLIF